MKKYIFAAIFILMLIPSLAAANGINVFVSILPQQFFLNQIGGNKVNVNVMVPPGASPELYEPKPSQMVELAKADLYFAIGMPFETTWLPKIKNSNSKLVIVHTDANVPKIPITGHYHYDKDGNIIGYHGDGDHHDPADHDHDHDGLNHEDHDHDGLNHEDHDHDGINHEDHDHDGHNHEDHDHDGLNHEDHDHDHAGLNSGETLDPHIWLDPKLVVIQGRNIADALIAFDPENADYYEKNYQAFTQRVMQVDSQVREKLKGLDGITFMTFHPAWGYYAKAYGLHQLTVEVGGREPSPAQLKNLMEQARAANVKAIFVQPQSDIKHARTIAKALKIKLIIADPLEIDWTMTLLKLANWLQRIY